MPRKSHVILTPTTPVLGTRKLMFKVACSGHQLQWETPAATHLHNLFRKWLKRSAVDGHTSGSFETWTRTVTHPCPVTTRSPADGR